MSMFAALNVVLVLIPLLIWPVLSLIALFSLRDQNLEGVQQALWVLVVLLIPIMGAVAFWIVKPVKQG
jgi:hypothetical protein